MVMISIQVNEELAKQLDDITDNKSSFIRQIIIEKLKTEIDKPLQDLEIELDKKHIEVEQLENIYMDKLRQLLDHKEELKMIEIQELENKMIQQKNKVKLLLDYTKNIDFTTIITEIKNKPDLINDSRYLMSKMMELNKIYPDKRLGSQQLKSILSTLI